MTARNKLIIAIVAAALLIGAYWLSPPIGEPLVFIACFTSFMLWALGITRTPGFVIRKRRAAAEKPRGPATPHVRVPERLFRQQHKRWVRAFLFFVGALPLLGGLACLALIFTPLADKGDVKSALVVIAGLLIGYGAFFLRYAQRLPQMSVRTDPSGVEAVGIFGHRRIAWDDVVAFGSKVYMNGGAAYQKNYGLYGPETSVEISGKLLGVEELLEIIRENIPPEARD